MFTNISVFNLIVVIVLSISISTEKITYLYLLSCLFILSFLLKINYKIYFRKLLTLLIPVSSFGLLVYLSGSQDYTPILKIFFLILFTRLINSYLNEREIIFFLEKYINYLPLKKEFKKDLTNLTGVSYVLISKIMNDDNIKFKYKDNMKNSILLYIQDINNEVDRMYDEAAERNKEKNYNSENNLKSFYISFIFLAGWCAFEYFLFSQL